MDTDKSLSEIAKSVLSEKAGGGDARSFREKAGLLALLNLLGIVESFYGELPDRGEASDTLAKAAPEEEAKPAPAKEPAPAEPEAQPEPQAPQPPVQPVSIVSTLAKLIGSVEPPAGQPQGGASLSSVLASLDPAMIASMVGMIAAMAKSRPKPPVKVEAQVSGEAPASSESGSSPAEPAPSPGEAPPSPLQQVLGIDPKVLTLILNVIAEFMKNRPAETKDKPADTRPAPDPPPKEEDPVGAKPPDRAAAVRTPFRVHRPGLGIYRTPAPAPKPRLQEQD